MPSCKGKPDTYGKDVTPVMLRNEYKLLKKANDLSADTLRPDNRLVLDDICRHLLFLTWNCYEIERIRKDLIDITARCELEGRPLQQEVGGNIDHFLMELAPDLPHGSPLDYVCIWYPKWMLLLAALYLPGLLLPGSPEPNLVRVLMGPFQFMLWLLVWAWFQRIALKIKIRYGKWLFALWIVFMLAFFIATSYLLATQVYSHIPGTISYLGAFLYELAWAVGCQCWQVFYYNRWAARHPWQEAPHTP